MLCVVILCAPSVRSSCALCVVILCCHPGHDLCSVVVGPSVLPPSVLSSHSVATQHIQSLWELTLVLIVPVINHLVAM